MYLDSFRKGRVRLEGDGRVVDEREYKVVHAPLRVIQTLEKLVWDIGLENVGVSLLRLVRDEKACLGIMLEEVGKGRAFLLDKTPFAGLRATNPGPWSEGHRRCKGRFANLEE